MSRVVTFRIRGRGADTDAPPADDWLDQIRDYLDILRGVEEAIAEDGQQAIDWRVVNASKNSPITVQLQAFPRQYAVNIDRRVNAVVWRTATGLHELGNRPERPAFFTDKVLAKAERTFHRVTNGLDLSEIEFGDGIPELKITPIMARNAEKNARLAQRPIDRPYSELAAIEGFFHSVERDGYGRSLLWIKQRLTGDVVKCILSGDALNIIGRHEIDEVFRGRRILVSGIVKYKSLGSISEIDATSITFFPNRADLPSTDDILDDNFTGGLSTADYLTKLRNGYIS